MIINNRVRKIQRQVKFFMTRYKGMTVNVLSTNIKQRTKSEKRETGSFQR